MGDSCVGEGMVFLNQSILGDNAWKFQNGFCFPLVGYGTASLQEHYRNVLKALKNGYTLIDTACENHHAYNTAEVGRAIRDSAIPRQDILIESKNNIWNHGYNSTVHDIYRSLELLQTDYIDVFLIHNPQCMSNSCEGTWRDTWRAMEDIYLQGIIQDKPILRAIGVSNFNEEQLIELLHFARVKPALVQNHHDLLAPDWFDLVMHFP